MTILNKILTGAATIVVALAMNSCQKEKPLAVKKQAGIDNQFVTKLNNSLYSIVLQDGALGSSGKNDGFGNCATITIDSSTTPHVKTIDFGSTGCTDSDGQVLRGIVVMEYNGKNMEILGNRSEIAFDNFSIDNKPVAGGVVFENTGYNGNGNMTAAFTGNLTITDPIDGNIQIAINQVTEFSQGQNTQDKEDDVISTSGGMTASNNVSSYSETILEPLILKRAFGCSEFYVQGKLLIQETNQPDKSIDYGDGTCDDLATETVDGQSTVITLQ